MTIEDNRPLTCQFSGTVFTEEFVEDILESVNELIPAIQRLNNKDKCNQTPPTREDVNQVLRNVDENSTLHECVMDAYNEAGALMMYTTHLLCDPDLNEKQKNTPKKRGLQQASPSKMTPLPRGMRNYILDSITKRRCAIPRHVSVWDEDDEEDVTAVMRFCSTAT